MRKSRHAPKTAMVSLRTLQRERASHRRERVALAEAQSVMRLQMIRLEAELKRAQQWAALPARLERIRAIIEEISSFYGLSADIHKELMAAVHHAIHARPLMEYRIRETG